MTKQKRNQELLERMLEEKGMTFDPKKEIEERANQLNSSIQSSKNRKPSNYGYKPKSL